ncbi:MAG: penicillin acylase family protein, partial [Flavobacteriaceae bacterium]
TDPEPQGSNGIALSGKLTASGNAMLLINPHTSFYFRGEVHMVSEEGLNAYGAVTWGQFFIYQGFNEKTGWMHTSSYTDVLDEYIETIEERDELLYYQYGDEWRKVVTGEVVLDYKDGTSIRERTFPVFKTHHGPITHKIGDKLVATAMMWEPSKALSQSYLRTKQNGYRGFREMMDIRTNSSNNTVYADAEGNIAYFHGNFIPIRDTLYDFTKPVDGRDPNTDWKGLHKVDENILVLNPQNGWIQNCNSTPFTSAAEFSPKRENYPAYMSKDQENFRGVHAIGLLDDIKEFTLDSLVKLAYDPYLPAFEALIPGLIRAYDQATSPSKELREPIAVLRQWNFRTSAESVGMSLAHYYGTHYLQKGSRPKPMSQMELINYFGNQSPEQERLEIFTEALTKLQTDFGSWKIPWGEINRYQRINGEIFQPFNDNLPSIPISYASGRWGALAAYGARYHNNTKKIYGTRGNSFVAVVEFGPRLNALSILAGGQSGDPESSHFDDQSEWYANGQFKKVFYYEEEVNKNAKSRYQPGQIGE